MTGPADALQAFVVGGAVRDQLLGRAAGDRDWVVVGATVQQMLDAGFKPVGADFPVFLHPRTNEEYALARTERKSAPGYRGFTVHADPSVTLEQDLSRRDLTINAMAFAADGTLIDPHGGASDLRARVLRHVSAAFAEDPVRILRVARFAARFADFNVAPETMALMRDMVASGEVDALVSERVWQELARALMEATPQRFVAVLRDCGALARLMPGLDAGAAMTLVRQAASMQAPLAVRFAGLGLAAGDAARSLCERLKVPAECRALALLVVREHAQVHAALALDAEAALDLLERCDALRRPQRFDAALLACECDARARRGARDYPPRARLLAALHAARSVDTADVARRCAARGETGPAVGAAIRQVRIAAIESAFD